MDVPLHIVIVSYNTRELLERCLASISVHPPSRPYRVAVSDNASPDGSAAWVSTRHPEVTLFANSENRGYAAAINTAIRELPDGHLLVLNSDVEVTAGCLDRLIEELERLPGVGAVGPRQVDEEGTIQISWGRFPGLWSEFARRRDQRRRDKGHGPTLARLAHEAERGGPVDWLSGSAILVKDVAMKDVGGMDEGYFLYFEDIDWCRRLAAAGWERHLVGDALLLHHRDRAMATNRKKARQAYRESQMRYWRRWLGPWRTLVLRAWLATRA